jgi:glutaredoxin 3
MGILRNKSMIMALACIGAIGSFFIFLRKETPVSTHARAMVEIYSKAGCTYCVQAKDLLRGKGVPFQEYQVGRSNPEKAREMYQRTGGKMTVPQIFIHGRLIGGFSELQELDYEGRLDSLLQEGVPPS